MAEAARDTEFLGLPARITILLIAPLSALAISGLTPVLSKINDHFAGTPGADTLVRLLVTAVGGAMIVGAPAAGILADRYGQRTMLIWSLALYAVSGAAGVFLSDLWLLLASRIIFGLAAAATGVLCAAMVTTRIEPEGRNRWLGFYSVFGSIGALILIPAAGALGGIDWRLVFLLHLLAIVPLVMAALTMSAAPTEAQALAAQRPAEPAGALPIGLILLGLGTGIVATTSSIFLPFHLVDIGEPDPTRIATAILPGAITSGIGAFCYGWIRKRLNVVETFAAAFLIAAAGTAMVVWATGLPMVMAGLGVSGFGIGVLAPNLFAAAAAAAPPERRARTIGFARAGFFGGPLVAQLPLEPLSRVHGAGGALLAITLFAVLMIAMVYAGRNRFIAA